MHNLHLAFLIVSCVLATIEAVRTRSLGWGAVAFLAGALLV